jgi:hypothetical protein
MLGMAGVAQAQNAPAISAPVTQSAQTLSQRITAVAGGVCTDLLSGRAVVPDLAGENAFWAARDLQMGLPQAALDALTPAGVGFVSQAVLASGTAADGKFGVAIGGRAGQTCRIFVYGTAPGNAVTPAIMDELTGTRGGWRELPAPRPIASISRRSAFRRIAGQPVLLSASTPDAAGPIAAVFTIAIIPANVTLPEGY